MVVSVEAAETHLPTSVGLVYDTGRSACVSNRRTQSPPTLVPRLRQLLHLELLIESDCVTGDDVAVTGVKVSAFSLHDREGQAVARHVGDEVHLLQTSTFSLLSCVCRSYIYIYRAYGDYGDVVRIVEGGLMQENGC